MDTSLNEVYMYEILFQYLDTPIVDRWVSVPPTNTS